MASSSTNKQPLLVDRPLLAIKDTSSQVSAGAFPPGTAIDPPAAAGILLVDCTKNDGAIIEDLWTISREQTTEFYDSDPNGAGAPNAGKWGYVINFYICPSNTVFNPQTAYFVCSVTSSPNEGQRVSALAALPEILAPVPAVGSLNTAEGTATQFRALYIPKGQCLWAGAVAQWTTDGTPDQAIFTPLVGAQGGYY